MLKIVKISVDDLEPGMFVSSLDRPWLETPFLMQGFRVEAGNDIEQLREYCQYVYIDTLKSVQNADFSQRRSAPERPRKTIAELFPRRALKQYKDHGSWSQEYPQAQEAVKVLSAGIEDLFDSVVKGAPLDVVKVKKSVEPMIDSVMRNPDACIWLARIKQEDHYTYQHSLGASIWAVSLGRQLGLPRSDLRSLAMGGLLFDVGKLAVSRELLNTKRPLSSEEIDELRSHVQLGVDMIKESGLMNRDVIDMISSHHERYDGSGYPDGLSGDDIPIFARIAAIVDCYDAITSHRAYARAIPPARAIKLLYESKDIDFQAELVEEFIQAVGIYPAGTLVELSTGEVGVVVAEYRTRRLRPQVMLMLDAQKKPLPDLRMLDLLSKTHDDSGAPIDIVNSLEPDAYGIDLAGISI
jgi:putative nucleotidyltransferase with HDIG domain